MLEKIWNPQASRADKMHSMAIEDVIIERSGAASESSDAGSSLAGVNLGMGRDEDAGGPLPASATLDETVAPDDVNIKSLESRQARQQTLPNTGATPPVPPTRQTPMGLQGGATGNNASWTALPEAKLDDIIRTLQDKHIDSKRTVQAIKSAGRQVADKWGLAVS